MWRIEGRVRAASTKHKFAPHPSRHALGHLRQFGDDRSFNLGCHVGRRAHEQRRLPRSREDHSVNFAVPVHDKGFDRTLRLRQAVRINPMHHGHLSSADQNIRRFSCAAAEAAEWRGYSASCWRRRRRQSCACCWRRRNRKRCWWCGSRLSGIDRLHLNHAAVAV